MVSNFYIDLKDLNDRISLSPEYYREKQNKKGEDGVTLGEIVDIVNLTLSRKNNEEGILLDTTNCYKGIVTYEGSTILSSDIKTSKKIAGQGDIIISRLRPYLKQIGYIDKALLDVYGVDKAFISTEYYILRKKDDRSIAFIIPFLLSHDVQERLGKAVEGGHHPRFKDELLQEMVIPNKMLDIRDEISKRVIAFVDVHREFENLRLSLLEDTDSLLGGD